MSHFPFRMKLTLWTVLPLISLIVVVTVIAIHQTARLTRVQAEIFETALLESKKAELENYMELGYTAIKDVYESAGPDDEQAKERVRQMLKNMEYGRDGYFFVYDYDGVNIAHPRLPELEGNDLWDFRDASGTLLIQDLIRNAKAGGGFTHYLWDKPSGGEDVAKLGYSIGLDRWQWMVGTGLYLDEIEASLTTMEQRMVANARNTFLLVAAVAVFSLVVIGIIGLSLNMSEARVANKKMVEIARESVVFQELEKRRISRELHDGINQLLVSARYKLEAITETLGASRSDELKQLIDAVDDMLETGMQDVRRLSRDLRPTVLDDFGLNAALESLVCDFGDAKAIDAEFSSSIGDRRLPAPVETALYRISQEALTNIEKHSPNTSELRVKLYKSLGAVYLEITDNGDGCAVSDNPEDERQKEGMGLRNMRDRARLLGGRVRFRSEPGKGMAIKVWIPVRGSNGDEA